jgi:hypothetical protein
MLHLLRLPARATKPWVSWRLGQPGPVRGARCFETMPSKPSLRRARRWLQRPSVLGGPGTELLTYAIGYKQAQSGRDDPRSNPPPTYFASQDATDDCR